MRVYAEYFEDMGLTFRKNTLLQIGDGWDLIGNAVLANPGSSEPIGVPTNEEVASISRFYEKHREPGDFIPRNWYEFSGDSTMRCLEKIFNGWYFGKSISLNGVIQLFNTFNVRDQNLSQAANTIKIDSDHTFSYNVYKYFYNRPTYFGFGNEVLTKRCLREAAEFVFTHAREKERRPYYEKFGENPFYHPMYVNRAHRQDHFQSYKDNILKAMVLSE